MLYIFKFPDIGEGITEGKILEWYAKKGQEISEGDPVVKVETDKVVADIPCPKTGRVKNTFGKVGEIINVDDALIELEIEGEPDESTDEKATVKVEEVGFGVVGEIEDAKTDAFLPATGEGFEATEDEVQKSEARKALATPVARKMAKDLGIDINSVRGTGPGGRVMKADIQRAFDEKQAGPKAAARPAAGIPEPVEGLTDVEELTQIRKTIAARMVESRFTAPHTTTFEEVEVSRLIKIRNDKKDQLAEQGIKLTYMPFIIKAVVLALKSHRKLNCRLDMQKSRVIYNNYYNIGFAVDTPDGLIVPVIKDADKKSIIDIAKELKDKSDRARERKLTLDELKDSTFSVTNYGSIAGMHGVPIINYPDVAILGIGRIVRKPVVIDDEIMPGNVLPLSLSIDHRIVDGADAARFIRDVMMYVADPVAMLVM
jgi:pyruvate dehydrogenase E2 component (dihydrolipoamide acetyltransferase)